MALDVLGRISNPPNLPSFKIVSWADSNEAAHAKPVTSHGCSFAWPNPVLDVPIPKPKRVTAVTPNLCRFFPSARCISHLPKELSSYDRGRSERLGDRNLWKADGQSVPDP
jgi:hypothetical protein